MYSEPAVHGSRPARLTEWNLDPFGFRSTITIEAAAHLTADAPAGSFYFCGNRIADFHGLLANMDPKRNRFRLWDLDAGETEGRGARFLAQDGRRVWVSAFARALHRVNPRARRRTTFLPGFVPAGLALLRDGTVMLVSSGTPGKVHRLSPESGRLQSWTLTGEEVPFSGVTAPDGSYYFAERRLSRIGRFLPASGVLTEWQLPGFNPQLIARDALGRIWLSDANFNNRIGRLDPLRNRVTIFQKQGVVTFSVRPVDRGRLGLRVAAADLASYIDVVRASRVPEVDAPVTHALLAASAAEVPRYSSRVPMTTLDIPGREHLVVPVDPPGIVRYRTPVVTPIDVTELGGVLYATAGTFNERTGPSRIFALRTGNQHTA